MMNSIILIFLIFLFFYNKSLLKAKKVEINFTKKSKIIVQEKNNIKLILKKFIEANRQKNFKKAMLYTIGKKKIFYKNFKTRSYKNLSHYFNRLKNFKIELIELSDKKKRAIAIVKFNFNYFDSISKNKIHKNRQVYYYLIKHKSLWKIFYSKLKQEKNFYDYKN